MPEYKHMIPCFTCGRQFQFGPHLYAGTFIRRYQVCVCKACYDSNWDGWAPHYEQLLIAHLEEKGLPMPERNAKGRLPRE